ncbi:hypothetical protein [Kitasatospora sp. NPDC097691]|uniref:hypothetical protein n=1 Tax=Kitasatospora sp. NPDC097691 TaxID=3157231 RepID=UPI00333443B6
MPAGAGTGRGARCASAVQLVLASTVASTAAVLTVLAAQSAMRRRQVRRARAVLAATPVARHRDAAAAPEAWPARHTHW